MSHKKFLVGISVLVTLCLLTTPVWGEKCKQVVVGQLQVEFVVYDPEVCDGYDGCVSSKIRGTFNGTLKEYFYNADAVHMVDDAWAFTNYGVIETNQGELFLVERSVADFAAPDGFACHINVVGGTGRYEGVTGWMAYLGNFEGDYNKFGGEVCWPDEK